MSGFIWTVYTIITLDKYILEFCNKNNIYLIDDEQLIATICGDIPNTQFSNLHHNTLINDQDIDMHQILSNKLNEIMNI